MAGRCDGPAVIGDKALCRHCDEVITLSPSGWRHDETDEHYCQPGDLEAHGYTEEQIEEVPQAEPIAA